MASVSRPLSYRFGKAWASLGRLGRIAVIVGVALVVVVPTYRAGVAAKAARIDAENTAKARKAAEAASAAAAAEAEHRALVASCTTNIKAVVASASASIKAREFQAAIDTLFACDGIMTDAAALRMLETARQGARRAAEIELARAEAAEKKRKRSAGVSIGMSKQDVLDSSWGRPKDINRTTTARGTREQWVYDGGYLYFEDGVLTSIQN